MIRTPIAICLTIAVVATAACRSEQKPSAARDVAAATSASSAASAAARSAPSAVRGWMVPSGPKLAILAGKGLGPIRFGATAATVERLMQAPCEIRTETACRYIGRGADFFLKDGAVVEMRVYRPERPTEPAPKTFGLFNGMTPEGLTPAMLPTAAEELIGKPVKKEPVKDGGRAGTVEAWDYKGLRLEFDKLPSGKVVIGAFILTKD